MSWQVGSFVLLALTLAGGFLWYERAHPSTRVIGLVAALAALAAAGRVALSPIPNLTPTTDIALLSGFALGGAPGFMVGALAALVSNFWLGQGPWTPWQMAGWGLAGIGGALLARATARRLGRLGLAGACALAGLAYGALLDLSVMVSYGGEQSLERYLALSARGLPFNLVHAAGNAAFAFAAGPALIALLARFRDRLDFRWREAPAGGVAAALVAIVIASSLSATGAPREAKAEEAQPLARGDGAAAAARAYLERAQRRDGGFGPAPGDPSSPAMTGWAALGLEASGRNPLDVKKKGKTPIDFLRSTAGQIRSTGDLERTILALEGAGVDARSFGGRDLVGELAGRRSRNGSFQGQVNLTAFGILALRASGSSASSVSRPARWLRKVQNRDGGWGFRPDAPSEADSTGAALQGLAAAGVRGPLRDGAAYLRDKQRGDGGWPLAAGGPTNSQSTAWAVQGLIAAGAKPALRSPRGQTPFDYLAARQARDGHVRYSSGSDQTPVWVTGQALLAIARQPFPLRRVARASQPGGVAPSGSQDGAGGGSAKRSQKARHARSKKKRAKDQATASKGERAATAAATDRPPRAPSPERFATAREDRGSDTRSVLGGLGGLTLLLAAGFLLYRRRLLP